METNVSEFFEEFSSKGKPASIKQVYSVLSYLGEREVCIHHER